MGEAEGASSADTEGHTDTAEGERCDLTDAKYKGRCHHHDYFWLSPLGAYSATYSQQLPEWPVLIHVYCFIHCEFVGVEVISDCHPCNLRMSRWSRQSSRYERCLKDSGMAESYLLLASPMALKLNSLIYADVLFRNYSLTHGSCSSPK